jgi:type IV secretory pathway VirB10-like protein
MDDAHIKHAGQQQPCQSSCPSQLPSNDADAPSRTAEQSDRQRRRNRQNRFGSNESSRAREDTPDERRDVKQESEARVHGRESVARQKEHERSMKVEQVDGGYLVTLGTYPGPEDFDKQIVRQLQVSD